MTDYATARLFRIVSSRAVCGAYVEDDRIVEIAPYFAKTARYAGFSWSRFVARLWAGITVEELR